MEGPRCRRVRCRRKLGAAGRLVDDHELHRPDAEGEAPLNQGPVPPVNSMVQCPDGGPIGGPLAPVVDEGDGEGGELEAGAAGDVGERPRLRRLNAPFAIFRPFLSSGKTRVLQRRAAFRDGLGVLELRP